MILGFLRLLTFVSKLSPLVAALLLLIVATSQATADSPLSNHVIYVNTAAVGGDDGDSWNDAFTDLQSALAAADSGDEIWVAAGIYKPTSDDEDRAASFQLIEGVAIYGGFASGETSREQRDWEANPTILSGDINGSGNLEGNSYHVVRAGGVSASAILDGFTVAAGNASGEFLEQPGGGGMVNVNGSPALARIIFSGNWGDYGGGMYNNGGSPTLTYVTFINNSASSGGGMYNDGGSPTLAHVAFSNNSASDGGGMSNQESSPTLIYVTFSDNQVNMHGGGMNNQNFEGSPSPNLTHVVFTGNQAGFGGGMNNFWSSPTLEHVTFHSNNSQHDGAGMFNYGSSPTLTYVTFIGNQSQQDGGGMYNFFGSYPDLTHVIFSGNSAKFDGGGDSPTPGNGNGGAISNRSSSNPNLTNVIFSGNQANFGGAVYNYGSSPTLTNVTFSGNNAANSGGGMRNDFFSAPTIQNSIFWHNQAASGPSFSNNNSFPTVRYSLAQGCSPGGVWQTGCGANGGNNLPDADPLFVTLPDPNDAPTMVGNLRLRPGSSAIDAGNNDYVEDATADLDGLERVVGPSVDLGAYESQYQQQCGFTADFPYSIGLVEPVTLTFSPPGDVDCVTVTYFPTDHSAASGAAGNVATSRYWSIIAIGSGYTAALSLPHDDLSDPKVCRWLEGSGLGAGWDCARDEGFTSHQVTRSGISQFSDWSVGNEVGPTAVTLQSLATTAAAPLLLIILLTVGLTAATLFVVGRRRLTAKS